MLSNPDMPLQGGEMVRPLCWFGGLAVILRRLGYLSTPQAFVRFSLNENRFPFFWAPYSELSAGK